MSKKPLKETDGEASKLTDGKKRVTIVRFNEPVASMNQSSRTHLMVPPTTRHNMKKVSITSSTFTEDLDGYLDPTTFTTDADDDAAEHVRHAFSLSPHITPHIITATDLIGLIMKITHFVHLCCGGLQCCPVAHATLIEQNISL